MSAVILLVAMINVVAAKAVESSAGVVVEAEAPDAVVAVKLAASANSLITPTYLTPNGPH